MENLQSQMNAILQNPQMMQTIMQLAQGMGQQESSQEHKPESFNDSINLDLIQKLSGFASQSQIDGNQKKLLLALDPYLSRDRVSRLERAMRAARMARLASSFLATHKF